MKKFFATICAACLLISGCGGEKTSAPEKILTEAVDIDLTKLSATMVYSAVFDMIENPSEYRGKTIKILTLTGKFDVYTIQKIDNPILLDARLAD